MAPSTKASTRFLISAEVLTRVSLVSFRKYKMNVTIDRSIDRSILCQIADAQGNSGGAGRMRGVRTPDKLLRPPTYSPSPHHNHCFQRGRAECKLPRAQAGCDATQTNQRGLITRGGKYGSYVWLYLLKHRMGLRLISPFLLLRVHGCCGLVVDFLINGLLF